jgi:TonB-linked SusC/RagA family outer membrane protein
MKKKRSNQCLGSPPVTPKVFIVMKMILLLLIPGTLVFSAPSYSQEKKLDLDVSNKAVKEIFEIIESSSELIFVYDAALIESIGHKSISIRSGTIAEILTQLFEGEEVGYLIDDRQVFVFKEDLIPRVNPQLIDKNFIEPVPQRQIRGVVTNAEGDPLPGVTVAIKGTTTGVFTNQNGEFDLSTSQATPTLIISYVGMKTREITVSDGASELSVVLEEETFGINEVVVTALGIEKESRALAYNVQKLDAEDAIGVKDGNLVSSLSGKVAGVTINSSSTGIGGSSRVVMRGTKSIAGNNNSLYVVDGIPLSSFQSTQPAGVFEGMGLTGDGINNFNPDDIESLSILSGPAAAALYGSEAANGVVIINTKKGIEDGFSLGISNNTSFHSPFVMPRFQNTYGISAPGSYYSWGEKLDEPSSYNPADFFQTGYSVDNSINLSAGNEKSSTYFSAGSMNSEGIIPNNTVDKYSISFRNTTKFLDDRFTLDISAMYMDITEQNMLAQGQYFNPLIPIYLFPPGEDIRKFQVFERYNPTRNFKTQYWPYGDLGFQMQNPYWIIERDFFINDKTRFLVSPSLKYDINDWLNITARGRIDQYNTTSETKYYASTSTLFAGPAGAYHKTDISTRQIYGDVLININKYIGDFSVMANAGASIRDIVDSNSGFGGHLQSVPNLFAFKNINLSTIETDQWGYHDQYQALFATAQLGYKSMLYLDLTARNDWSTALANTDTRSILYPSIGLSGILTDMFDIDSDILSYLKARVSYSEVGNAPRRFISTTTYPVLDGYPQLTSYMPASNLEPERTKSYETGLNMILWNNKVNMDFTLYKSSTYNQLFNPSLSPSTGYSSLYINAGRIDNKGIEAAVNLNQNLGPVEWNSRLIFSLNRNEIVELLPSYQDPETGETVKLDSMTIGGTPGARMVLVEGGTMGDIYVNTLKQDDHGFINVGLVSQTVTADPNRFIKAGSTDPLYNLGFSNSFNYKGLNFNFLVTARVGGIGVSVTQAIMDAFGVSEATAIARDNGGVSVNGNLIPAKPYYQTVGGGTSGIGALYVYSATNVRLSEMSIGYDIPLNKLTEMIESVKVSIVGRNLFMIYNKAPFDPEITASTGTFYQGIDYFMPPSLSSIGFNIGLRF